MYYENEVTRKNLSVGRILRGFRLAARLGLSLSRDIEAAFWAYSSLVMNLDKVHQLKFYDGGVLP